MARFSVLALLAALVAQTSFAGTLTCRAHGGADADTVAVFNWNARRTTVSLSVPTGESSAKHYLGVCKHDEGAIETSSTCNIMASSDSGYIVRLFSIGGSQLFASVQSWAGHNKGPVISLKCPGIR